MRKNLPPLLAVVLVLAALPVAAAATAPSNTDPPIISWQPPASWSPSDSGLKAFSRAGVTSSAFTDISAPLPYIAIAACRQYDSRTATPLTNGTTRAVTLSAGACGIPTAAQAVAVNITVFNITGAGSNGVFNVGNASPPTIAWINYPPTETQRGNAGVVSVAAGAVLYVQVNQGAGSVNFTVDVFGYYASTAANTNNHFTVNATAASWGAVTGSNTTAAGMSAGVLGLLSGNTTLNSAGTIGYNDGAGTGVWGWSFTTGRGVFGQSGSGPGVWGESTAGTGEGVHGKSAGGVGVLGETAKGGVAAVLGVNNVATNASQGVGGYAGGAAVVYGVQGEISASAAVTSAGVHGISAMKAQTYGVFGQAGDAAWAPNNLYLAGGRFIGNDGGSSGHGVLAEGITTGLIGSRVNVSGAPQTMGIVGALGNDGLYSYDNITAVGTKSFVEPHPIDPALVIKYVALEGPEAGTYFRGRGRFVGGRATIDVPENFRAVTDTEGLTVQVTPIGRPASVAVVSMGLDAIEVESTGDVEFSYLVQGVRRAYRDFTPTQSDNETLYFIPQSPTDKLRMSWPPEVRQRLITKGTYNSDGTVNLRTAERMGWAQKWREEERLRQEAVSRAPEPEKPQQ